MSTASVLVQSLRLVWRSSPRLAVLQAVIVAMRAALPLIVLWSMGALVDATLEAFPLLQSSLTAGLRAIAIPLSVFGVAMFGNYAVASIADIVSEHLAENIRLRVASLTHDQMSRLSYQTLQSPQFQTEAFRAISGSTERPVRIFFAALSLLQSALTFMVLAVWMMGVAWWLPLLALVAGAPILVARLWSSRQSYDLYKAQTVNERKMHYYNRVLTHHTFAPELRLFSIAQYFRTAFANARAAVVAPRLALSRRAAVAQIIASALSTIVLLALFVGVIALLASTGGSIGRLAMCLMTIRRAESAVADAAHRSVSLHSQGLYVRSLFEFLNMREPAHVVAHFPASFTAINVEGVSFRYPGSDRQAVSGVSFTVWRGQVVGIAGPNGCGKSTLAKMLCGLLRPDAGTVSVDSTPIADIPPDELSAHITAVFQDFRLYNAPADANIHFGDYLHPLDNTRLHEAAAYADMDALISSLPHAYNTQLGSDFPGSEMFSRGEWQRLALARALYSRADILILDEAASSLDPAARQTLHRNINRLREERKTVILISHSAETLSMADVIVRLDA